MTGLANKLPRVDFYVLPENKKPERFACALVGKAWTRDHQVYVHTASSADAARMDDLLWTFRDSSFLPHAIMTETGDEDPPIVIGWQDKHPRGKQVMLNLAPAVPSFATDFERIIEIVAGSEEDKRQARGRYRHYRDLGCDLHNHSIDEVHD